jgi:hypothetical protein
VGRSEVFAGLGALLLRVKDLDAATEVLKAYAVDPCKDAAGQLAIHGIRPDRVTDFLGLLPTESRVLACDLARAWAIGRLSHPVPSEWAAVVTTGEVDAAGIDRRTAETMLAIVVGAESQVRLFSPFVDDGGIGVLLVALAAASKRKVRVVFGFAAGGKRDAVAERFEQRMKEDGDIAYVRVVAIGTDRPFPHLKVICADGRRAYIGSANLTWPALTSNAEIGAFVTGRQVRSLEAWFDGLTSVAAPGDAVPSPGR